MKLESLLHRTDFDKLNFRLHLDKVTDSTVLTPYRKVFTHIRQFDFVLPLHYNLGAEMAKLNTEAGSAKI